MAHRRPVVEAATMATQTEMEAAARTAATVTTEEEEAGAGAIYRLRGADTSAFLAPLPVSRLPRVGAKTAARLREIGADTVGEVLALGASVLEAELGNHGLAILEMARGQDRSPVRVAAHPQSIGREATFSVPCAGPEQEAETIVRLAISLANAMERQGLRAGRVALRLFGVDGATTTRSITLGGEIAEAREIYRVGLDLLQRGGTAGRVHRGLGITLAGLKRMGGDERQLDLSASAGRVGSAEPCQAARWGPLREPEPRAFGKSRNRGSQGNAWKIRRFTVGARRAVGVPSRLGQDTAGDSYDRFGRTGTPQVSADSHGADRLLLQVGSR